MISKLNSRISSLFLAKHLLRGSGVCLRLKALVCPTKMDDNQTLLNSIIYLGLPCLVVICFVVCCAGAKFKLKSFIPKAPLRAKVTVEEGEVEIVDEMVETSRIQAALALSNTPGSRLSTSSAVINVGQPPEYGSVVLEQPRAVYRSDSRIGQFDV